MEFLDLFSGIGGFRRGLERSGHRCIGHVEIDKYANISYMAMYGLSYCKYGKCREGNCCRICSKEVSEHCDGSKCTGEWFAKDIKQLTAGEIPRAEIWTFGFPCTDISLSGKRAGLAGERSGLFFTVAGLLKSTPAEDKPRILIVENVKHLLSSERGGDFTAVSLIICFGLTPMFNNALKSKVSLVRVNTEIHKGDQITEKMITTVEVGGYNLPDNVVYRAEDVVGKYANTDLYKGDYILESKLSDTPMLKNAYLGKLNGENRAISVSIKSLAAGLSGKLEAGDIVTLIASDVGEKRKTLVLPELQYVEIIATTASSGTDNDVQADVEDGEEQELASTITVLATPEQARLLAELEQTGKLHAALVFRGDSTQAQKFLDEQQKVLEELYTEELEGEAETAEADAEEEKEEPIVDDVEVNAGGQ